MVKEEVDGPYDANKYFYIMKMALDIRNNKMMVNVLNYIQVWPTLIPTLPIFAIFRNSSPMNFWTGFVRTTASTTKRPKDSLKGRASTLEN